MSNGKCHCPCCTERSKEHAAGVEATRAGYRAAGRCYRCGAEKRPDRALCDKHLAAAAAYQRKIKARRTRVAIHG